MADGNGAAAEAGGTMTFSEFGQQFIDLVLTPERIGQQLASSIPKEMPVDNPGPPHAWGKGSTSIGQTTRASRGDPDRQRFFETPITIKITLYVDLLAGQENYNIVATFTLRLLVEASKPLKLNVSVSKLSSDDIKVVSEGAGNWFDIAQKFGLDGKVRDAIAAQVNDAVSKSSTTIDVLAMVQQSQAGPGPNNAPAPSHNPLAGVTVLKRGADPATSTLGPDGRTKFALPPGDHDDVEVTVYAQKTKKQDDDGTLSFQVVDSRGGKALGWGMAVFAFGEDWDMSNEPVSSLTLDGIDQAFVVVENDRLDEGKSPTVTVRIQVK